MGRTSDARERLLRAASDLLWEKNYHAVTVEDVCARARVNRGSFYYFFASKSALIAATLQYLWDTVGSVAFDACFSPAIAPFQRLTNFLEWVQCFQLAKSDELGRAPGSPIFSLGCELGPEEPVVSAKVREIQSAQLHYFTAAIRDAIAENAIEPCEPHLQALCLSAMMEGIVSNARIMNDVDCLKALTRLPATILRVRPATAH